MARLRKERPAFETTTDAISARTRNSCELATMSGIQPDRFSRGVGCLGGTVSSSSF